MNKYDVMYDGEVMLSYVEEDKVKAYFAEVRKDYETDKATGFIDADFSFDDEISNYSVVLYIEVESFL